MIDGEIEGQRIVSIHLPSCGFEREYILVRLDTGEVCKMNLREFNKVLNLLTFQATPKRKYSHLTITATDMDPAGYVFE